MKTIIRFLFVKTIGIRGGIKPPLGPPPVCLGYPPKGKAWACERQQERERRKTLAAIRNHDGRTI